MSTTAGRRRLMARGGKFSGGAPMEVSNMRIRLVLLILASLSPLPHSAVHAQSTTRRTEATTRTAGKTPRAPGGLPSAGPSEQEQRVLSLLHQAAYEARNMERAGFSVVASANVADALWDLDEEAARALFEECFRRTFTISEGRQERVNSLTNISAKARLRREVVGLIARHDLRLARTLIESTTFAQEENEAGGLTTGRHGERASLYLGAAGGVAESDPRLSANLARASIDAEINSLELVRVLSALRRRDAALADETFRYALTKSLAGIRNPALSLRFLAPYVFPDFRPGAAAAPAANGDASGAGPDARLRELFLDFVYNEVMAQLNARQGGRSAYPSLTYSTVRMFVPYFDRYRPNLSTPFRLMVNRLAGSVGGPALEVLESDTDAPLTAEQMLGRAEKSGLPFKDVWYQRAAAALMREGKTEQAFAAAEKIGDGQMRLMVESGLGSQLVTSALRKGDYDAACVYAGEIPWLQQRASMFAEVAGALFKVGKVEEGKGVIAKARESFVTTDDTSEKTVALLTLAEAAARVDVEGGFQVMKDAVDAINRGGTGTTPDGSLVIRGKSGVDERAPGASESVTAKLVAGFVLLGGADLERALSLAGALESKEASLLARVSACRA
ncbi:MAG: hypothetical protein ABW208_14245, partial [Pyrinomonadaceae bacterium]